MIRILAVALTLILSSCQSNTNKPILEANPSVTKAMKSKPALVHTVFFWTKEGTTSDQHGAFEEGLKKLGTCPQIAEFHWGQPASTEKRDVVDNSYNYAINVHFTSLEDQAEYQDEPIHLAFIEAHKDIWEKVIVYDNKVN